MVRSRKTKEPEPELNKRLTEADIYSITGVEATCGTARFLPSEEAIAEMQKTLTSSDPYLKIIEALYVGDDSAEHELTFNEGFTESEEFVTALFVFLMAHLVYLEVDSEIRILGLTYLLKQVITIGEPA